MTSTDRFIGETVTGSDYKAAYKRICRDDPDVMALPLQAFYDASYVDTFGSLQSSPFIVTPLGVQAQFRHTHDVLFLTSSTERERLIGNLPGTNCKMNTTALLQYLLS